MKITKNLRLSLYGIVRMSKDMIEDHVTHIYGMFVVNKCGKIGQKIGDFARKSAKV